MNEMKILGKAVHDSGKIGAGTYCRRHNKRNGYDGHGELQRSTG